MGRAGNVPIGYWWLQLPATPLLFPGDRLHVLLPYLQPLDPLFLFPALASLPKRGRVKDAAKRERLGEEINPPFTTFHYVCTIGTTLHHLDILQRSFYQNLWSMHCSFNPVLQKSVFLFLWLFEELCLCMNCHRLVYGGEQTDVMMCRVWESLPRVSGIRRGVTRKRRINSLDANVIWSTAVKKMECAENAEFYSLNISMVPIHRSLKWLSGRFP